jgi:AraC-like DNA-binding protein
VHHGFLRRMHLARLALMQADPAVATVTQIATDVGFWELGRFSVQYKWLFGESPSATLKHQGQRTKALRSISPLPGT